MQGYKKQRSNHEPVLAKEAIRALAVKEIAHLKDQARFIDATVGAGGHATRIIKSGGLVLGIDTDKKMLEIARRHLKKACLARYRTVPGYFKLVHGNFRRIDELAKGAGFEKVDGIIFDLGVSNIHLTSKNRGFSFREPSGPLDMRLDRKTQAVKAADLLNGLREDQLTELFSVALREGDGRRLAKAVVLVRGNSPIKTVGDFLRIVEESLRSRPGFRRGLEKRHFATLPFLALRIAVNSELENLKIALPKAFGLLNQKARLVVISFHSGEDAIVKSFFRNKEKAGKAKVLTKKPIVPSERETKENPKARSAKMRALQKL